MTARTKKRPTKGAIERDARELLQALDREYITSPRSLNVATAIEALRVTLSPALLKDSDA